MPCKCADLDDVFYLDTAPKGFEKRLRQLDMADWKRLYECPECGTLWAIDEWDKYQHQVASKIETREDWSREESDQKRKELLQMSRGGTDDGECIWSGCTKPPIKGVVYCIDHLYETGARR